VQHSGSLHMQRIACESPINKNQEKSSLGNTAAPEATMRQDAQLKAME